MVQHGGRKQPLSKREKKLQKEGKFAYGSQGEGYTRTEFGSKSWASLHYQGPRLTGLETRRQTSDNSWVHAVLFVVLLVIVVSWALGY